MWEWLWEGVGRRGYLRNDHTRDKGKPTAALQADKETQRILPIRLYKEMSVLSDLENFGNVALQ